MSPVSVMSGNYSWARIRVDKVLQQRRRLPGTHERTGLPRMGGALGWRRGELNSPAQASSLLMRDRAGYRSHGTVLRVQ